MQHWFPGMENIREWLLDHCQKQAIPLDDMESWPKTLKRLAADLPLRFIPEIEILQFRAAQHAVKMALRAEGVRCYPMSKAIAKKHHAHGRDALSGARQLALPFTKWLRMQDYKIKAAGRDIRKVEAEVAPYLAKHPEVPFTEAEVIAMLHKMLVAA